MFRLRTGLARALLFSLAMGLHFVLTDRGREERYPDRFGSGGLLALGGSAGQRLPVLRGACPSSALLVALLAALLAGSILRNVFKEEIPSGRRSSFGWFVDGFGWPA